MDPYRILGVPKDCTREEVKEAFRTRAPTAHPDHGGEASSFVELRAAYEQILAELDRRPRPRTNAYRSQRVPRDDGKAKPPVPTANAEGTLGEETPDSERPNKSPDPVSTREAYHAWLDSLSARTSRRSSALQKLGRFLLVLYGLYAWFVFGWMLVAEFLDYADLVTHVELARRIATPAFVFWIPILVGPFLLACWIAFKYDLT